MEHIFCVLNNIESNLKVQSTSLLKVVDKGTISIGNLSQIKGKDVFVADGGINFLDNKFLKENKIFWIGDRDSIEDGFLIEELCFYKEELNRNKDFSDFARVLDYIIETKKEDIFLEVFNGLGGDRSHEYSNILEIKYFLEKLRSFSKRGTVFMHPSIIITNRKISLMLEKNRMFSVISLENNNVSVNIEGAKYQGKIELVRASLGTRNISTSNIVEIDSRENIVMVVVD